MFQQAEYESLCGKCHHGHITVFVLSQCEAVCVAKFDLSEGIIVSPLSLYVISFELTRV